MSETDGITTAPGPYLAGNVVPFIVKACVVSVIVSACIIFVADWVIGSVEYSVSRTISNLHDTTIGGRKFWARIEQELDRAAAPASDLSPERKQKLVNDIRVIVARWRPVIDALQDSKQAPAATSSDAGK